MAQIVSDTPGRLRVRLRPERRRDDFMRQIHGHLHGRTGIAHVATNPNTGSVTVRYDPQHHTSVDVLGLLRDLGVIAETVMNLHEEPEPPELGKSTAAAGIVGAIDDLDDRIARFTGYKVDLKVLFPLGLGALGVYQLMHSGFEMAEVPGYVLLWYAFDSFFKLHVQAHQHPEPEVTRQTHQHRLRAAAGG